MICAEDEIGIGSSHDGIIVLPADAPVGTPDNPSHRIFTVANVITFCRLALTIAFLVLFAQGEDRYVSLALYAVAAITDFLDGTVARATQTVSWVGKIMDPIMDRILLLAGVLGLMLTGELPLWVAAFVIIRDGYLAWGAWFLQRYRRRPVDVVYSISCELFDTSSVTTTDGFRSFALAAWRGEIEEGASIVTCVHLEIVL